MNSYNNQTSSDKLSGVEEVKREFSGRKPFSDSVTCHGCGEVGHIRPQCPKNKPRNVSRVLTDSNSDSDGFVVSGTVCGIKRDICLDTGAQMCVIPAKWCPDIVTSDRMVDIFGVCGSQKRVPTANVDIQVLGTSLKCCVALVENSGLIICCWVPP